MSWIEVRVSETVRPATGATALEYVVEVDVVLARGIAPELFVYAVNDDSYSHVALPYDLLTYPADAGTAKARGQDFYRRAGVVLRFAAKSTAAEAAAYLKRRLGVVNRQWQDDQDGAFGGVSTTIFDSGDA